MKTLTEFQPALLTRAQEILKKLSSQKTPASQPNPAAEAAPSSAEASPNAPTEGETPTAPETPQAPVAEASPVDPKAALGEELKIEGDRLEALMKTIQAVEGKTLRLKRVVVLQLSEGEKAPSGSRDVGGFHLVVEYYPAPAGAKPTAAPQSKDRPRGGKKGERGGDRKKRGNRRPPQARSSVIPAIPPVAPLAKPISAVAVPAEPKSSG